jgi:hypothetical protein
VKQEPVDSELDTEEKPEVIFSTLYITHSDLLQSLLLKKVDVL